jgi:hypothetical protein
LGIIEATNISRKKKEKVSLKKVSEKQKPLTFQSGCPLGFSSFQKLL